ncbi:hypothetical protein [Mycobacterium sp.]|uniref:hypothetical protein n=1 Tax=Mycobacterium sp. TaxID=1785 RepID=UPI003BAE15DB
MIGETVYDTGDHVIWLRSFWVQRDGGWFAAQLENFAVDPGQKTLRAPGRPTESTAGA